VVVAVGGDLLPERIVTRKRAILSVIFDSYGFADYHTRHMSGQLPETIKPQSLVDNEGHVSGFTALDKMERLAALLENSAGTVETQLDFGRDARGIRFIRGSIRGELPLRCQRCLEAVTYPVDIDLSLALVVSEDQADRLPEGYEPLFFDSTTLSLITLIEDELLLALPIVAMHPEDECSANKTAVSNRAETDPALEKPHPFASLAQLKGKLDSTH
jgi:uncharacterized protein